MHLLSSFELLADYHVAITRLCLCVRKYEINNVSMFQKLTVAKDSYRRRLPPLAPPEPSRTFDITLFLPPPKPFNATQQSRYSYNLSRCEPPSLDGLKKMHASVWTMQNTARPCLRPDMWRS